MSIPTFKVPVIGSYTPAEGSQGVGKTTWINSFKTKSIPQDEVALRARSTILSAYRAPSSFTPTLGCEVSSFIFKVDPRISDLDKIRLKLWDCAGQAQYSGLQDGYLIGSDAVIVGCTISTMDNLQDDVRDARRVVGDDVPIITVLFKSDELDFETDFVDCLVSTSTNHTHEPIHALIRKLVG